MEFTDNEYAKMRLELATDAAKAVLRHIVMYERRCKGGLKPQCVYSVNTAM